MVEVLKPDFRHRFVCVRWRDGWIHRSAFPCLEVGLIDGMAVDEPRLLKTRDMWGANTVGGDGVGSTLASLHLRGGRQACRWPLGMVACNAVSVI